MAAMKSKQAERLSVLRMMKAAIRNKEIDSRQELDDPQAVQVLLSLIKQRKDSVEQFTNGGRLDLADKESSGNQGDRGVPSCRRGRRRNWDCNRFRHQRNRRDVNQGYGQSHESLYGALFRTAGRRR